MNGIVQILQGDCFELIKQQPDNSVDLVITSPPYVDIVNYGKKVTVKSTDTYVDWILPLFKEIHRVLKPSGSFILNINDKTEKGLRSTYIYDLISRNDRETKLKLYDTYIWHKKNGIPNGGTKRFRNNTEFLFHFVKDVKQLKFYMDRVLEEPKNPIGDKKVKVRKGHMKANEYGQQAQDFSYREIPDLVRPDNVFRFSTAASARDNTIKHPAPYHKELPLYFINLLTDENDIVLDTFSGIGTTGLACKELNRDYIGYELNEVYHEFSIKRLNDILEDVYVVNQYDLDGNFIESFNTHREAAKKIGFGWNNLKNTFSRNYAHTCGGFIWKLEKKID